MLILSTKVVQKSLETEFLIAIGCLTGDKWQSKTLFLVIFDPLSSIVKSVIWLSPIWCVTTMKLLIHYKGIRLMV